MLVQLKRFSLLIQCRPTLTISFRLKLPISPIPNLDAALHLAWVLTPYLGINGTHQFLVRFGFFLVPGEDGYWRDALPGIELL